MKKQHAITIILAIAVVITLAAVAWGTLLLLRGIDSQKNTSSSGNTAVQSDDQKASEEHNEAEDIKINKELNEKAELINKEAVSLMESNPIVAKQKYLEAADAYSEAGNLSKASSMRSDAMTTELLIQQQASETQN